MRPAAGPMLAAVRVIRERRHDLLANLEAARPNRRPDASPNARGVAAEPCNGAAAVQTR